VAAKHEEVEKGKERKSIQHFFMALKKFLSLGWGCSSVAECSSSMHMALVSIPSTKNK
jgi:hypothetical protein